MTDSELKECMLNLAFAGKQMTKSLLELTDRVSALEKIKPTCEWVWGEKYEDGSENYIAYYIPACATTEAKYFEVHTVNSFICCPYCGSPISTKKGAHK